MSITEKILCSKSHEYLLEENGNYIIGLTDYAIEQLAPNTKKATLSQQLNRLRQHPKFTCRLAEKLLKLMMQLQIRRKF